MKADDWNGPELEILTEFADGSCRFGCGNRDRRLHDLTDETVGTCREESIFAKDSHELTLVGYRYGRVRDDRARHRRR